MKQTGSAVLIAMIVVSILGVVGFSVSRLAIMELRISNINDAADRAYAAAEAGLEYALYQASIDVDATISSSPIGTPVVPAGAGQTAVNGTPLTFSLNGTDESAEILMYHETFAMGSDNCQTNQVSIGSMDASGGCESIDTPLLMMQPDESFTFAKPYNSKLYLRAEPANIPPQQAPVDANKQITYGAVELTGYNETGTIIRHELINLGSTDRSIIMDPTRADAFHLSGFDPVVQVTLRFYGDNRSDFDTGSLFVSVRVRNQANQLVAFDSNQTTIEVVGKVPGHERRLRSVLNRQTKQIIGIFDYALYATDKLNQTDAP